MKTILQTLLLLITSTALLAQETVEIRTGSGNSNQVWYGLETGKSVEAALADWDLGFSINGISSTILTNTAKGMKMWVYDGSVDDFEKLDTTGLTSTWKELNNSDTSWAHGAFSQAADPSNAFDLGWGTYNMTTHQVSANRIFVLKMADEKVQKIMIEKLVSGTYFLRHASLDNAMDMTHEIKKSDFAGKNFGYFDLASHKTVDLEPMSEEWDLLFTKYTTLIPTGPNSSLAYAVAGVLSNSAVRTTKVYPVDNPDTYSDYNKEFHTAINTIGYNWKKYDFQSSEYVIEDSTVYLVQAQNGDVWKLIMTGYGGTADGKMTFTKSKIYSVGTGDVLEESAFSMYPNPTNTGFVNVSLEKNFKDITVLNIINTNGRIVQSERVAAGQQNASVSVQNLNPGVYLMSLQSGSHISVDRLIIE